MGARKVYITTPYITLDQLLKWAGLVMTGGEARGAILEGRATVNGQCESRRGRKLREEDVVSFDGQEIIVARGPEA